MADIKKINEGESLRIYFKGSGISMGDIAEKLKMSRQNLGHHLRKPILEANFARTVETVFKIDLIKDVFAKLKTKENVKRKGGKEQLMMPEDYDNLEDVMRRWKNHLESSHPMDRIYKTIATDSPIVALANLMRRVDDIEDELGMNNT